LLLLSWPMLAAAADARIPDRPRDAAGGAAFIEQLQALDRQARDAAILAELQRGNLPAFLRRLQPVRIAWQDVAGVTHRATIQVMPDVLAIGSDRDFVRMPMNPLTAQAFCDAFGFALPTRKLVDETWRAARRKLWPQPLVDSRESPLTFLRHHRIIEEQLRGTPRGALVAGHKKDVVVTNRLREEARRVAIFGWHKPSGEPIQPLSILHGEGYVDYSHGVRPLSRRIEVDGRARDYYEVLKDPLFQVLLSDEGPVDKPRYDR
jgi:hypothetical protein